MLKWLIPAFCLCCCSGLAMSPQDGPAAVQVVKAEPLPEAKLVSEVLKTYTDVFNKHDATALVEYWAPKGVSVNTETGTRLEGRENIKTAFEQLFKSLPDCKLNASVKHYRFLRPDLLTIEGSATLSSSTQEPVENTFTVLLVKVGDTRWNIEHAAEAPVPVPASPYDGLKDLEWMVGTWSDETPGVTVESQIAWNEKKTFLIRKYTMQYEGDTEADTGSQVIGFDPRSKTIRSWTFTSDGSFGDATWSQVDNEWRVKLNHINSDGTVLSATQIITKVDDNTATVQMIGQEVDGALAPTLPAVKMVRKPAAEPQK